MRQRLRLVASRRLGWNLLHPGVPAIFHLKDQRPALCCAQQSETLSSAPMSDCYAGLLTPAVSYPLVRVAVIFPCIETPFIMGTIVLGQKPYHVSAFSLLLGYFWLSYVFKLSVLL